MRIVWAAAVGVALMLGSVREGGAYYGNGPWCAVQSIGHGTVTENCSMRSFEQCRLEVVAGNRGFCQPNPRWVGAREATTGKRKPRHRGSH
jgi:hypothetical protein